MISMHITDFGVDIEACRKNLRAREQKIHQEREAHRKAARTDVLAAIKAVLPHYPDVRRVFLFGSITRPGAFHTKSDVDIAVEGTNAERYFALWRDLEAAAPNWFIDLRDMKEIDTFAKLVRQRGELVYEHQDETSES